jgi:exodeoxyribonuclease III
MLKIYNWNVNGIRAVSKKGFWEWFFQVKPDIICVQETKADHDAMTKWWTDTKKQYSSSIQSEDLLGTTAEPNPNSLDDYEIIWHSCSARKGYSGTAIIYNTKTITNPITKIGIGNDKFDIEGRTTILETKEFTLINCYYPQGGREGRILYKIEFYEEIINLAKLYKVKNIPVILCGDLNTTRTDIDLARPKENRKTTGCLPEEREVIEKLINCGYADAFRHFYPDITDKYTYWDQITRARNRNVGWRIDYFLVDEKLIPKLESCEQLDTILGSDHCPVLINII